MKAWRARIKKFVSQRKLPGRRLQLVGYPDVKIFVPAGVSRFTLGRHNFETGNGRVVTDSALPDSWFN